VQLKGGYILAPTVGFYRKFVFPRLINASMSNKESARCRSQIVPQARGRVLEIGIGSGFNLAFYSNQVTNVYGLDPSPELLHMARKRARSAAFPVELLNGSAEDLPLKSDTVDTIVMTWTLCSIPDANRALTEMRRVLKPGGDLLFVEHGLAPEPRVRAWQNRINRPWRSISGGCNLNREIDRLISSAGFRILRLDSSYMPGPRMFTFTYRGCAQPK
jgi:ubiquinone/menaquinone biosynthesis C-methylase UbiE